LATSELLSHTMKCDLTREALHGVDRIRSIVRGLMLFSRADTDRRTRWTSTRARAAIGITSNEIRHRPADPQLRHTPPSGQRGAARPGSSTSWSTRPRRSPTATPIATTSRYPRIDNAGWAVVEIRDTGTGIPPPVQAGSSTRSSPPSRRQGTG